MLDPAGTIVYASPSWQTLPGWDPEGLVGTPFLELVHPDDHASGAQRDAEVLARRRGRGDHRAAADDATDAGSRSSRPALPCTATTAASRTCSAPRATSASAKSSASASREVDALYRVADAIARATSLEELFDEAIDTLLEATGADRAAVLLHDDEGVMRFHA